MLVSVKVCSLDVIPSGTIKQFNIKDCEVLIINDNGQFSCLDARCTHAGAPLEEGILEGDVLTCPWHGSQFRITDGSVVRGPAEKQLKTYLVTVADGAVFIDL
jgi:nitrite reductase/ring-hydroxylating ferredoxin subunit